MFVVGGLAKNAQNRQQEVSLLAALVRLKTQNRNWPIFPPKLTRSFMTHILADFFTTFWGILSQGERINTDTYTTANFPMFHPIGFPIADKSFPDNGYQRLADGTEQAQVAQCLLQQPAVVRLRLHTEESGMAEHPAQHH